VPILESLISIQRGSPVPPEKMARDKELVQEFIRFFNLKYIVVHAKDRIGMGFFMRADAQDVLKNMKQYIQTVFPIEEIQRDPYDKDVIVYNIQSVGSGQNDPVRIDFGTPAAHFSLAYNWSRDEVWDGKFPFNWAKTKKSGIFMRLQNPKETTCTLRVAPFSYPKAPQQHFKIYLNGRFIQKFLLDPSWKEYTIILPADALRVGVNRFDFHYNYAASPDHVLGTPDARKLSVAFDSIECHSAR
jgi:hypothetical protein